MDEGKERLLDLFMENVYNNSPNIDSYNSKHDGASGNWLEKQFGKNPDSDNSADFWGYECKNHTTSKTTWGDWTANEYIFDSNSAYNLDRNDFLKIFGKPNITKNNRYSWSGEPVPSIPNKVSKFGQEITVDDSLNVIITYDFSRDARPNKFEIIPNELKLNDLVLAKWYGYEKNNKSKKTALETKVNKKFNQKGWFKCLMENNVYKKIVFGEKMNFSLWIKYLLSGDIYFDSGMYEGNFRPYSVWRSDNKFWDKLVIETYPKDT